eukprot:s81_g10.t4
MDGCSWDGRSKYKTGPLIHILLVRPPAGRRRASPPLAMELKSRLSQALALEREKEQVPIRTWANIAWSVAKLTLPAEDLLQTALASLGPDGAAARQDIRPQELANIVWSVAATSTGQAAVVVRCITGWLDRFDEFEAQHVSNMEWSSVSASEAIFRVRCSPSHNR